MANSQVREAVETARDSKNRTVSVPNTSIEAIIGLLPEDELDFVSEKAVYLKNGSRIQAAFDKLCSDLQSIEKTLEL